MVHCKCGEEYDFEGWNVNEACGPGNAYHLTSSGGYRIKYTICTKCKEKVILSREKWAAPNVQGVSK